MATNNLTASVRLTRRQHAALTDVVGSATVNSFVREAVSFYLEVKHGIIIPEEEPRQAGLELALEDDINISDCVSRSQLSALHKNHEATGATISSMVKRAVALWLAAEHPVLMSNARSSRKRKAATFQSTVDESISYLESR